MTKLTQRFSITMAICTIAALAAVGALFLPPNQADTPAPAPASSTAAPAELAVAIENFQFQGIEVVQSGDTVVVTNVDSAPHTLTSNDGLFDTGMLAAGESVELTLPTAPGTYGYFCQVHPGMTGSFTVTA